MLSCIIIEDQPPAQRILKKYIADLGTLELKETFSDALKAIDYLNQQSVDLIFLDIHLPKLSGMEFLKTLTTKPAVILTTAFPDFALESYDLDVSDYLLKPFSFARFVKAVSKVNVPKEVTASTTLDESLFIKSGHEHIKVDITDILFIKSDADYTDIFTKDKKVLSSETLKHWEERLQRYGFMRVHKSYLIQTDSIKRIRAGMIYLEGQHEIPIGRSYKEEFEKKMLNS